MHEIYEITDWMLTTGFVQNKKQLVLAIEGVMYKYRQIKNKYKRPIHQIDFFLTVVFNKKEKYLPNNFIFLF